MSLGLAEVRHRANKPQTRCTAVDELQKSFIGDESKLVACTFCDYKDTEATKPINLIADLLHQVLTDQKTLPKGLTDRFEEGNEPSARPSLEEMHKIFLELASTQQIYLVLDALDECPNEDDSREHLIRQLALLNGACNILLTSRPSVSIKQYFDVYLTITVAAKTSDIEKYISGHLSSRLQTHIRQKPSLYDEIRFVVTKKAQNMYVPPSASACHQTIRANLMEGSCWSSFTWTHYLPSKLQMLCAKRYRHCLRVSSKRTPMCSNVSKTRMKTTDN